MLQVGWVVRADNGLWLPLGNADMSNVTDDGVYVIWMSLHVPNNVVKVGQGDVRDRIGKHRRDARIIAYSARAELLVTWASVPAHLKDGVERYLADCYHPLVGDAYPDVLPVAVNLPGA